MTNPSDDAGSVRGPAVSGVSLPSRPSWRLGIWRAHHLAPWQADPFAHALGVRAALVLFGAMLFAACSDGGDGSGGTTAPPIPAVGVAQIGAWDATAPSYETSYYVRPPGESYGSGDGSSWTDAFADLPAALERGARYYLASGDYDEAEPDGEAYTDYTFDDPDDGRFIGIVKATAADHGTDEGWDAAFGEGAASFGPLAFETGHYVIEGSVGSGDSGHGIRVAVHPDACPSPHTTTITFPWNAQASHVALHHVDASSCATFGDPTTPAQDTIYGYMTDSYSVSHVTVKHCYVHDTKRVHAFLLGWSDVLIEDSLFDRSGMHHESSALAMRAADNVVVRRNVFRDAINVYVSLQTVQHVYIYSNVFIGTLEGREIWNSIHSSEPATDVHVYGNTFYGLVGLSTGLRFSGSPTALHVVDNIWAANRTNQIPLAGEHDYNLFWDNLRVDGDSPQDLSGTLEEPHGQLLDADPFVDAAGGDLHLASPTAAGLVLEPPYDRDADDEPRGADGSWDRGAYEHAGR